MQSSRVRNVAGLRRSRLLAGFAAVVSLTVAVTAAAPAAAAAIALPPLIPARAPAIAPVAAPLSADPDGVAPRGTMIMVHGGGWAGHDAIPQRILMDRPGALLRARGWRVVSLDYDSGTAGLQDVLDAADAELARRSASGPLCLYGESSGAHLALVAAARRPAIDCVIGLGTPTDLPLYEREAAAAGDPLVTMVADRITTFFGPTDAEMSPWNPVALAPAMRADVLLIREGDDAMMSTAQDAGFQAARPTTLTVDLQAGDPADPAARFVHGTVSEAGRIAYGAAIGAFADREVIMHRAEASALRSGCARTDATTTQAGMTVVRRALRCLARHSTASRHLRSGAWKRTSMPMRGQVDAARIWSSLLNTRDGRRAIAATSRARSLLTVRLGPRSQVTLRVTARGVRDR